MEEKKSGAINVRVPLAKAELLDQLSREFGLSKSRMIKFAVQRFMDLVEHPSSSTDRNKLFGEVLKISEEWKTPRPTTYRTKRSRRAMLVSEEVDGSWEKPKEPKKRGRKKKDDKDGEQGRRI